MPVTRTAASFVISPAVHAQRDDRRDRELLGRLAAGDGGALAEIYGRHASALFRHALALAHDRSDAEDLVQSAFVKLATIGAPLLGVRRPASYLHRILRAAWIDVARHRSAAPEQPCDGDAAHPMSADVCDAIDLRHALAKLPELQREVVVLHLFGGFSFREIGDVTDVSTFTAGSRYRLAIERLRLLLGER